MNQIRTVRGSKVTTFDLFVFWFVIIDNLFLPYFWVKMVSYSFPFVFLWFLVKVLQNCGGSNKPFRTIEIIAGLSTIFGCLLYPRYASDDIVLYLNLLLALFSYQLFCRVKDNSTLKLIAQVHKVLYLFVVYVFAFALLFYFNSDLYEQIRHMFTPRIDESTVDVLAGSIRFGYYWSDENNVAYMVCSVVVFLLIGDKISFLWKNLLIAMAVVIVVATMSTGGLICLGFTIFVYFFTLLFGKDSRQNPILKFLIIIFFVVLSVYGLKFLFSSDVYQLMVTRFEGKTAEGGDGRTNIYQNVLENVQWWKYVIWGYGGRTIIDGIYRSTHNGFLHLIVAYGMIVCLLYTKLYFFKNNKQSWLKWAWRIPVLVGFFLNIMITEDKTHVLMMILLAYESHSVVKNSTNNV